MRFLDADILSYALAKEKSPESLHCLKVLKDALVGKEILISNIFVPMQTYYILVEKYRYPPGEARFRVDTILSSKRITFLAVDKDIVKQALKISEESGLKPFDASMIATMRKEGIKELYSHDADFDIIEDITRLDPIPTR